MGQSRPEISVVVSVYNGSQYLRDAVESILTQQGVSLEMILVNDGSTDDSLRLLLDLAARDPRVTVIDQKNVGLTASLIGGCKFAMGEFIARQDADDVSLPGRLRKQCDLLQQDSSLTFVSSTAQGVGPDGELLEIVERPSDPDLATHQLLFEKTGPPAHGSVMMRRTAYEAVGGYRPEFYYAQDSDLWLRLARSGKLAYCPEVLYRWRVSPTGISTSRQNLQWRFGDLGQACHAAALSGESELPFLHEAAMLTSQIRSEKHRVNNSSSQSEAWGLYRIGTTLLRQKDVRARKYFLRTIQTQPYHFRAWVRLIQTFVLTKPLADEKK